MTLPIPRTYAPMEAKLVGELPTGADWHYEPKWDGFRCVAFRDGDRIDLMSKAGKPLARYFPELLSTLAHTRATRFVLDGEIVIPRDGSLSFDALLLRIHPAKSRITTLSQSTPATFVVFDLLVDAKGKSLVERPLAERRERLEAFVHANVPDDIAIALSPATTKMVTVKRWFRSVGGGLDGVMAKRRDLAYASGTRDGMQKMKHMRTAECVVGGFRYASRGKLLGALLLGLYDDDGLLHHVGFTSNVPTDQKGKITTRLEKLMRAPGFTGQAPGGPSRWSTERSSQWEPLAPKLVVEVKYDHFSGGRFRHATSFLRWRPDKPAARCTMQQVVQEGRSALALLR